jgi:phospholipid transport system transporter-binding protein
LKQPRFSIEAAGSGRLKLAGELSFDTAAGALVAGTRAMRDVPAWELDLSSLDAGDSAGVAVLVEWIADARRRGSTLRYKDIPPQMLAIARISAIDDLLLGNPRR